MVSINPFNNLSLEKTGAVENTDAVNNKNKEAKGSKNGSKIENPLLNTNEDDFVDVSFDAEEAFEGFNVPKNSSDKTGKAMYSAAVSAGSVTSSMKNSSVSSEVVSNDMDINQLLSAQEEKQAAVNQASKDVASVQNGSNEAVKNAVDNENKLKEAYEEALKQDEDVSKELKEKQEKNSGDIEKKEGQIKEKETAITEAENQISDITSQITSLDAQISSLNSSLNNVPAKTDENKDQHSKIDEQIKSIKNKISTAEAQKKKLENSKTKLENQKNKDEKTLKEYNESLDKLKVEQDKIEKEIQDSCSSETKEKLQAYKEARTATEQVKANALNEAQGVLQTAQAELDKINALIQSKQNEKENKTPDKGEEAVGLAVQYDGLPAEEMKRIMTEAGYQFDEGNWCADFVTFITAQTYGKDNTPGDFFNTCRSTVSDSLIAQYPSYCPDITTWGQERNAWSTDSSEAKPGDFVLYCNENGTPCHIGMVESVNPDGTVNTIEGNTSDDGGNYGDGGFVNGHPDVSTIMGYVLMSKLRQ